MRAFLPAFAWAISRSTSSINFEWKQKGATQSFLNSGFRTLPVSVLNKSATSEAISAFAVNREMSV